MRLVPIQPPDVEPLTVEELRARLNIVNDEIADEVLSALISAARQGIDGVDGWIGRALITQTWQMLLDDFFDFGCNGYRRWSPRIYIPLPPLQAVTSITFMDSSGAIVPMDNSDFEIRQGQRPFIEPAYNKSWPSVRCGSDAVTIEFVAGYGDAGENVPEPIRQAIALEVNRLKSLSTRDQSVMIDSVPGLGSKTYATGRDAGSDILSTAAQMLLSPYRVLA